MAKLRELGKIITGNTPKTSEIENYSSKDICFVKPSDISENDITYIDNSEFYLAEAARDRARILPPKSILVTCIGILGKIAINQIECAFNQQINAIIPNTEKCIPSYLAYAIQHRKSEIQNKANAAVVPIINKSQFSDIEINLTSLDNQLKIVTNLDKVSNLISLRKEQLAKLDELVKARFVEMFGDPQYNSFQWQIEKLEKLCTVGSSKRIYQSEQASNGIPFLRISDLVNRIDSGVLSCDLYIPEERYEELKEQGLVPITGDILITARGTLGKCYTIVGNDKFYFQDGMITWLSRFDDRVTSLYISHLFSMPGFKKQIDNMQSGSTVAYLSIAMAKNLDVMLPPIKLQEQFAAITRQIDKQKLTIQQSLDKLEVLKKSLMQEYFGRGDAI